MDVFCKVWLKFNYSVTLEKYFRDVNIQADRCKTSFDHPDISYHDERLDKLSTKTFDDKVGVTEISINDMTVRKKKFFDNHLNNCLNV